MPFKTKTPNVPCKSKLAMAKFRRLKTIMRKMLQASKMCGKEMSLLVYDKNLNNMTEYYTNDSVKLEHIF